MELALALLGSILGVFALVLSVYNTIQIKAAHGIKVPEHVPVDPLDNVRALSRIDMPPPPDDDLEPWERPNEEEEMYR